MQTARNCPRQPVRAAISAADSRYFHQGKLTPAPISTAAESHSSVALMWTWPSTRTVLGWATSTVTGIPVYGQSESRACVKTAACCWSLLLELPWQEQPQRPSTAPSSLRAGDRKGGGEGGCSRGSGLVPSGGTAGVAGAAGAAGAAGRDSKRPPQLQDESAGGLGDPLAITADASASLGVLLGSSSSSSSRCGGRCVGRAGADAADTRRRATRLVSGATLTELIKQATTQVTRLAVGCLYRRCWRWRQSRGTAAARPIAHLQRGARRCRLRNPRERGAGAHGDLGAREGASTQASRLTRPSQHGAYRSPQQQVRPWS